MLKCVHERHHASEPRPLLEALASIVLTASSLGCLASRGARSAAEYPVQRLRRYEELGAEPDEERRERQGDDNARKHPERRGDHRRIRPEWSAVRLQQHIGATRTSDCAMSTSRNASRQEVGNVEAAR